MISDHSDHAAIKGTDESRVDFSVPLMHHDPNDPRSQIRFRILPKKRILSLKTSVYSRNWPIRTQWAPFCNSRGPFFFFFSRKGSPKNIFEILRSNSRKCRIDTNTETSEEKGISETVRRNKFRKIERHAFSYPFVLVIFKL